MADEEYGPPDGALVLNQLHIIEYIDPDDNKIYKMDLSYSRDGDDLSQGKYFELCEWARMIASSEIVASLVHDYIFAEEDGDEDGAL